LLVAKIEKKVVLNHSMQSGHRKDIAIEAGISKHNNLRNHIAWYAKEKTNKIQIKDMIEKVLEISHEPPLF